MSHILLTNSRWRCSYILLSWKRQTHRSNSLGGRDSEREREREGRWRDLCYASCTFPLLSPPRRKLHIQAAGVRRGSQRMLPSRTDHACSRIWIPKRRKESSACGFRVVSTLRWYERRASSLFHPALSAVALAESGRVWGATEGGQTMRLTFQPSPSSTP